MKFFRVWPLLMLAFWLAACTAAYPPQQAPRLAEGESRWFKLERLDAQGEVAQTSLLAVQGEGGDKVRWVQTDAFGAPQARLLSTPQGWVRDGFVWPNREAEQLFQAMFPLLAQPPAEPAILPASPNGQWRITPVELP